MAHRRLTREEREFLKRRVSEERKRRYHRPHGNMGLAEAAYNAAKGDGLYALSLALDALRSSSLGEGELKHGVVSTKKQEARRSIARRISFEELMKSA